LGLPQLKLAGVTIDYLSAYQWPGNVRELEHAISRAALKASGKFNANHKNTLTNKSIITIQLEDCDQLEIAETTISLPNIQFTNVQAPLKGVLQLNLRHEVDDFQRKVITKILTEEQGNITATAKRLEIDRANLNRLTKRLGITIKKSVEITAK